MNKYEIYCTAEQTAKAIELGAPIDKCFYSQGNDDAIKLPNKALFHATIPTASQMIGWLEEQSITEISITKCSFVSKFWGFGVYSDEGCIAENTKDFNSREEATLSAIDSALEYLTKNNK